MNVLQVIKKIYVTAQNPPRSPVAKAFYFEATEGQSVFTLDTPYKHANMVYLAINGTLQALGADRDYTIVDLTITLNEGISEGDKVYGVYDQQL